MISHKRYYDIVIMPFIMVSIFIMRDFSLLVFTHVTGMIYLSYWYIDIWEKMYFILATKSILFCQSFRLFCNPIYRTKYFVSREMKNIKLY